MNLQDVSPKHAGEMESLIRELLLVMRKAKLHNEPLSQSLQALEKTLGDLRRERFDAENSEYHTY